MRMPPGRLLLARVTALPAIAVSAWLLVTFPLLALGVFTPVAAGIVGVPAVVAACALVPRLIPAPDPRRPGSGGADDDVWSVVALVLVLAIAVAFAVVQIVYHAEALVIRRDPASYAVYMA